VQPASALFFMGQSVACCAARPPHDDDDRLRSKASGLSKASGRSHVALLPLQLEGSEAEEWAIIKRSIGQDELEKLRKLRSEVQHCDQHASCQRQPFSRQPQTLLRFLRGREGDVKKASIMFINHLHWREEFGVDEKVARWQAELAGGRSRRAQLVRQFGVEVEICTDKFGVPVRLIRLSVADTAGSVREVGNEAVLLDTLLKLERTHAIVRRAMFQHQQLLRGQIQIIDVGDYGRHGVPNWYDRMLSALKHGPDLFRVVDANYPETVRKVFFIRLGFVTKGIYNSVQFMVPQRTQRKLRMFGSKAKDWIGELREELKPGQVVPAFLERDDDDAFATATPKGGRFPVGGSIDDPWDGATTVDGVIISKAVQSKPKGRSFAVANWPIWLSFVVVVLVIGWQHVSTDVAMGGW